MPLLLLEELQPLIKQLAPGIIIQISLMISSYIQTELKPVENKIFTDQNEVLAIYMRPDVCNYVSLLFFSTILNSSLYFQMYKNQKKL